MGSKLTNYRKSIDKLIKEDSSDTDWEKTMEYHLQQIEIFQHERFVHLLVTVLVALLTFMALMVYIIADFIPMIALVILFLVLLVPYIKHYWVMENETQKLYYQYDEIFERCHRTDAKKSGEKA